jgi:hypothetical protein
MNHYLKTGGNITMLIAIASNLWFMFQNGDPDSFTWYLIAVPFLMWIALPFAAVYLIWKEAIDNVYTHILFLFTACIISVGGFWIVYDAFVLHLDPQSGLVFLVLPVLQLIVVAVAYALNVLLSRFFVNRM